MDNLVNVSFRINKDVRISTHLTPNEETIEAMLEARRIANDPSVKSYTVEEALKELRK